MSKDKLKVRFPASEHTTLRVGFIIYPTRAALNKAADGDVWGLCETYDPEDLKRTVAVIKMSRDNFMLPVLAHEAYHATMSVVKNSHLTGESEYVDEMTADTLENIFNQCVKFALRHKINLVLTEP
jgi:hypothetical protein